MPCASLIMLGSPDGSGCDGIHYPIHKGWKSKTVSRTGMCQRVCEFCNVIDHLVRWLLIFYNVCISHIV